MIILPAIDIYEKKVVRLVQGDYSKKKIYSDDPFGKACEFTSLGATHVHVVDLEGARDGLSRNVDVIQKIITNSGLAVEVGGGIRTLNDAERYLNAGAWRIVLGTAALTDADLLARLVRDYGSRITVGVDISGGRVAMSGWTELSQRTPFFFAREMVSMGIKTLICTDISRDGLLSGANDRLYGELNTLGADIIASGGIASIDGIIKLSSLGIAGVILGKALYEGVLDLKNVLELSL